MQSVQKVHLIPPRYTDKPEDGADELRPIDRPLRTVSTTETQVQVRGSGFRAILSLALTTPKQSHRSLVGLEVSSASSCYAMIILWEALITDT